MALLVSSLHVLHVIDDIFRGQNKVKGAFESILCLHVANVISNKTCGDEQCYHLSTIEPVLKGP